MSIRHPIVLCLILGLAGALLVLWLLGGAPAARAATLCVDLSGAGGCYTTIQAAVNAASANDTIENYAGTYFEHVTVDKTLTFVGAGANQTIVDGGGIGRVFNVTAGSVFFSDLTIQNGNAGSSTSYICLSILNWPNRNDIEETLLSGQWPKEE